MNSFQAWTYSTRERYWRVDVRVPTYQESLGNHQTLQFLYTTYVKGSSSILIGAFEYYILQYMIKTHRV